MIIPIEFNDSDVVKMCNKFCEKNVCMTCAASVNLGEPYENCTSKYKHTIFEQDTKN